MVCVHRREERRDGEGPFYSWEWETNKGGLCGRSQLRTQNPRSPPQNPPFLPLTRSAPGQPAANKEICAPSPCCTAPGIFILLTNGTGRYQCAHAVTDPDPKGPWHTHSHPKATFPSLLAAESPPLTFLPGAQAHASTCLDRFRSTEARERFGEQQMRLFTGMGWAVPAQGTGTGCSALWPCCTAIGGCCRLRCERKIQKRETFVQRHQPNS